MSLLSKRSNCYCVERDDKVLFLVVDLCGTPGYLAPEVLKVSMYENAVGYGKPVDM